MESLAAVIKVADEIPGFRTDALCGKRASHQYSDDTHGLRCVIGTVADAKCGCGEMLEHFEELVNFFAWTVLENLQEKAFQKETKK